MGYNTNAQIRTRLAVTGNVNIATTSIISAITNADGIVNGMIGKVYSLPLSVIPGMVRELAGQISEGIVLKQEFGPEVADTDKDGQQKIDDAMDILKLISDREMSLFSDTTGSELTKSTNTIGSSFPNSTSDQLTTSASTAPVMRMNMKF